VQAGRGVCQRVKTKPIWNVVNSQGRDGQLLNKPSVLLVLGKSKLAKDDRPAETFAQSKDVSTAAQVSPPGGSVIVPSCTLATSGSLQLLLGPMSMILLLCPRWLVGRKSRNTLLANKHAQNGEIVQGESKYLHPLA